MFKMILNSAKTWLFSKHDPEILREIMSPGGIGVISSKCCHPASATDDEKLIAVLEQCVNECDYNMEVKVETITTAQKSLRTLKNELTEKNKLLTDQITALFQSKGLNIFPITVIDGDIVFYGGVPTKEMVTEKLLNIIEKQAA